MSFQFSKELLPLVLDGTKTQTRRPFVEDDHFRSVDRNALYRRNRKLWEIGKPYAIVPGRGKKGVGFLTPLQFRYEDVRKISRADAKAEGFETPLDFLAVWCGFYDNRVKLRKENDGLWTLVILPREHVVTGPSVSMTIRTRKVELTTDATEVLYMLRDHRPEELYRGWAIDFKRVPETTVQS